MKYSLENGKSEHDENRTVVLHLLVTTVNVLWQNTDKTFFLKKLLLIVSVHLSWFSLIILSLFDFTEENKDNKHDLSLCT